MTALLIVSITAIIVGLAVTVAAFRRRLTLSAVAGLACATLGAASYTIELSR